MADKYIDATQMLIDEIDRQLKRMEANINDP